MKQQLLSSLRACAFAVCAACASALSALTPEQAFVGAPPEIIATIDSLTRLDMIDYFHSGSARPSKNALGGDARIVALDSAMISVATSAVGVTTLVPLTTKKGDVVMAIQTLLTPAPDSSVTFYAPGRAPLKADKMLKPLRLADWLTPKGRAERSDAENAIPFILAEAVYSPSDSTLVISNTLSQYFSPDEWASISSWLKPSLSFRWNGTRFVPLRACPITNVKTRGCVFLR